MCTLRIDRSVQRCACRRDRGGSRADQDGRFCFEGDDRAELIAVVVGVVEDRAEVEGGASSESIDGRGEGLGGGVGSDVGTTTPPVVDAVGADEIEGSKGGVGAVVETSGPVGALRVDGAVQGGSSSGDQSRCPADQARSFRFEGSDRAELVAVVVGVVENHAEIEGGAGGESVDGRGEGLGGGVGSDVGTTTPPVVDAVGADEIEGSKGGVGAIVEASRATIALGVDRALQGCPGGLY